LFKKRANHQRCLETSVSAPASAQTAILRPEDEKLQDLAGFSPIATSNESQVHVVEQVY
jgi:hypothetical protein